MEGKKISFGFSKTRRAPDTRLAAPVQSTPEEEQRDYIDCLEEKAIKIVGGEVIEEKKPLVIPMKPNTLVTAAERLQQIAAEVESSVGQSEAPAKDPEPAKVENETLEQQVERELMEDARNVKKVDPLVMAIQMEKLPPLEGQKESTLDDYESVPIADFGLAMLRGMGWTPGKESKYSHPSLRPKGLGLGADKLVKQGAVRGGGGADEEEIKLRKGCHVRVTAGKHSGAYGKVVSMDDESGRAVVELAMRRESVSVSEHMLQPVSKQHYEQRSRVINSDKYEEYKKKELIEKERNEKNSKKASQSNAEKSSRRPESSKQDTTNGREKNEGTSHNQIDLSSSDDKKRNYKESSRNEIKSQLHSSSEDDRKEQKSRKSPEHSQRSASNGNDRYKREQRSRDRSTSADRRKRNEPSRSRRSSFSSIGNRKEFEKINDKSARNRSSSGDRTEQKSRKERRTRKSSTSSEDSRTRRKKKSSKQRDRSSGSESLNSVSSDEPRRVKKSKKKKSDGKRDIDKKRKGKKKRRDRDRSPNYRKHKR